MPATAPSRKNHSDGSVSALHQSEGRQHMVATIPIASYVRTHENRKEGKMRKERYQKNDLL